jgi:hypothetical protein
MIKKIHEFASQKKNNDLNKFAALGCFCVNICWPFDKKYNTPIRHELRIRTSIGLL